MPLWKCSYPSCEHQGVRAQGDCVLCERHICGDHLLHHDCLQPTHGGDDDDYRKELAKAERKEIDMLKGKIKISALVTRCSELRQGMPCQASIPDRNMGGMNFHVDIRFEDGVTWMARFRRSNATSPPARVRDLIVESEAATLRYLEKLAIPSPKLFDFALESKSNPVGVPYILMEKLSGKPPPPFSALPQSKKEYITRQLADIFVKLYEQPLTCFGALTGSGEVGPFAQEFLIDIEGDQLRTTGPMSSEEEYFDIALGKILTRICDGEEYVDQPIDAYLMHRSLLASVKQLVSPPQENQRFYLNHVDDKGDHLLVDDEGNICGIIDWQWARTAPAAQAFKSPLVLVSIEDFYKGKNGLGADEKFFAGLLEEAHPELAQHVRNGRLWHRFDFCCGFSTIESWDQIFCHFMAFMNGLVEAGYSIQEDRRNMASKWHEEWKKMDAHGFKEEDWKTMALRWYKEWRDMALEWYRDDYGLQLILSREFQTKTASPKLAKNSHEGMSGA